MPVYSFTLFASFCIFPPTSLTILKCFKCDAVFDGARESLFLAADYSIRCGGRAYAQNVAYAGAMVFVYPLGVPLLYLCMLVRHRAGLDQGRTRARPWPTSKAPLSVVSHSFCLIFGRPIISRNDLEA